MNINTYFNSICRILAISAAAAVVSFPQSEVEVTTNDVQLYPSGSANLFQVINSNNIYDDPAFIAADADYGLVGTASRPLWEVHTNTLTEHSDERSKTVISDIKEDVLEKLKGVRSVTYKKNLPRPEGKKDNRVRIGFLAQNLQENFPEAVYYDKKHDTYAVEYTRMIPVLVSALNAQQKRIEQLEARIGQAARNPGNN